MYLGARVSRLAVTLTFDLWQPLVQHDEKEILLDYNDRMSLCGTGGVCAVFYYYPDTCGSEGHGSEQWFLLDFIPLLTQSGTETPRVSSRPSRVLPSPPRFFQQGKDEGNDRGNMSTGDGCLREHKMDPENGLRLWNVHQQTSFYATTNDYIRRERNTAWRDHYC